MLTACQSHNTPDQKEAPEKISVKKQGANQKTLDQEQNQQIKEIASTLHKKNQQTLVLRLKKLAHIKANRAQAFNITYEILKKSEMVHLLVNVLTGIKDPSASELEVLANACFTIDDHNCVASALLKTSSQLEKQGSLASSEFNNRLWDSLVISEQKDLLVKTSIEASWTDLALQFKTAPTTGQKIRLWQNWIEANLMSPIALNPPATLIHLANFIVPKIAVILPLSGELGSIGIAVRDGIVANYFSEEPHIRGKLTFYDSESSTMSSISEEIRKSDATLIIGPLLKHHNDELVKLTQADSIPVLLLNYLDEPRVKSANQYSIGLSIKDEVDGLINQLKKEKRHNLLIVKNNSAWASRASGRLQSRWPISTAIASFEKSSEMTSAIGFAAGSKVSLERETKLSKLLTQPIEFMPRSRKDIDAVVVFITPMESRSLEPILKFHYLDSVPVYSSSQSELNKLRFTTLSVSYNNFPFMSQGKQKNLISKKEFNLTTRFSQELFAFGLDAYNLAQLLPAAAISPNLTLAGETGMIILGDYNTFKRSLQLTTP